MPTIERAKHIQKMMGGDIYYDREYHCFRVMKCDSPSLWDDHYIKVGE